MLIVICLATIVSISFIAGSRYHNTNTTTPAPKPTEYEKPCPRRDPDLYSNRIPSDFLARMGDKSPMDDDLYCFKVWSGTGESDPNLKKLESVGRGGIEMVFEGEHNRTRDPNGAK